MHFGVNAWSYPESVPVEKALEHAKSVGYEGFQAAVTDDDLNRFSEEKWKKIKATANEIGIEIPSISTGLFWQHNFMTQPKEALKIVEAECRAARIVGARLILVIPGTGVSELSYEDHYTRAVKALKEAGEIGRKYGIRIGLENVWNRVFAGPLEFQRLIEEVDNDWVQAYFDVGNTLPHSLPEHWIRILNKKIIEVHVKDYAMSKGAFGIPFNGDVNWLAVRKALEDIDYDGYILPEVPAYPGDPYEAAEDSLRALQKIFK